MLFYLGAREVAAGAAGRLGSSMRGGLGLVVIMMIIVILLLLLLMIVVLGFDRVPRFEPLRIQLVRTDPWWKEVRTPANPGSGEANIIISLSLSLYIDIDIYIYIYMCPVRFGRCSFPVSPFRRFGTKLVFSPLSVFPFWPQHRLKDQVIRFKGHAKICRLPLERTATKTSQEG